jgi:Ca-activated chloride channel family protein
MRFAEPTWIWALAAPLVMGMLITVAMLRQRAAVRAFVGAALAPILAANIPWLRRIARGLLVVLAATALSLSLARPQWDPEESIVERKGRDIAFVVDVSRSMLARDLAPDRLGRARIWIQDLVGNLGGDRVALVAFAGTSVVKCPLTLDHAFFRLALEELDTDAVSRGGTLIGDAIRHTVSDVFHADEDGEAAFGEEIRHRDIILITDGEDHESFPVEAAKFAGQHGVRIIALGLGSAGEGAPVPGVEFNEQMVVSRLDTETLTQVAASTPGGVFLNVGTGNIDLESVYADLISTAQRHDLGATTQLKYREGFQAFIAAALLLLLLEALIGDGKKSAQADRARPGDPAGVRAAV